MKVSGLCWEVQDRKREDRWSRTEKDEQSLHTPSSRRMEMMMRAEEKL